MEISCLSEVVNEKEGYILSIITESDPKGGMIYKVKIENNRLETIRESTINDKDLANELFLSLEKICVHGIPSKIGYLSLINSILLRRQKHGFNKNKKKY